MNEETVQNTTTSERLKRLRQISITESFKKTKISKPCVDFSDTDEKDRTMNSEFKNQISSHNLSTSYPHEKRSSITGNHKGGNHVKQSEFKLNFMDVSGEHDESDQGLSQSLFSEDESGSSSSKDVSLGVPISEFKKMPECCPDSSPLKPSSNHTILFHPHFIPLKAPLPFPDVFRDKWDNDFVRMPCSRENLYPIDDGKGGKKLENRWNIIKKALLTPMASSLDLEEAIMKYNARYNNKWNFTGLHLFFTEVLDSEESQYIFNHVLPAMVNLALQLPEICTQPIPLLRRHRTHMLTLSQKQIGCLLANAFFCTFPRRNAQRRQSEYATYPDINFTGLFMSFKNGLNPRIAEKLKCLFHYFRRITDKEPVGCVTFHRQHLSDPPKWDLSTSELPMIHITSKGTIEDNGQGMLQVDFANKFVGGGVLKRGCVQEEIRFVICPELIISRLFTEMLDANECLIVTGCEKFSKYVGYADNFKWAGNHEDTTPRDNWNRCCTQIVAIDAVHFRTSKDQYLPLWLGREINKAFCGFYSPGILPKNLPAVATGNWGCGVYRGDVHLKSLLQIMAAAEAGRDLLYFTFHNPQLCEEIYRMYVFLTERKVTVGELWKILLGYHKHPLGVGRKSKSKLYDFIYETLNSCEEQTDSDKSSEENRRSQKSKRNSDVLLNEEDDDEGYLLNLYKSSVEENKDVKVSPTA